MTGAVYRPAWLRSLGLGLLLASAAALATPQLSRATYTELSEIRTLMEQDRNEAARRRLEVLSRRVRGRAYELAMTQQHLAYALIGLQRLDEARTAVRAALGGAALPKEVRHRLRLLLAQVCVQTEAYKEAVAAVETWLRDETDPAPEPLLLAARAHYALSQLAAAARYLRAAIRAGAPPRVSWYEMLVAVEIKAGHDRKALRVIDEALARYPRERSLWLYRADIHLRHRRYRKALSTLLLAHREGLLERADRQRIVALYGHVGAPEKAARILRHWRRNGRLADGPENRRLEADLWTLAREREPAREALIETARVAKTGEPSLRLARLLIEDERWPAAVTALRAALDKGHLPHPAQAQLLLGIAASHSGATGLARRALTTARADPRLGEQAERWLRYLSACASDGSSTGPGRADPIASCHPPRPAAQAH